MQLLHYIGVATVIAFGSLALAGTAEFPKGTFALKAPDNAVWAITFDGKGKATVTRDGKEAVEGTYKVTKDEVEFVDKKGPFASTKAGPGTYRWKLEGKKLTFTKIKDEAEGRASALTSGAWELQEKATRSKRRAAHLTVPR